MSRAMIPISHLCWGLECLHTICSLPCLLLTLLLLPEENTLGISPLLLCHCCTFILLLVDRPCDTCACIHLDTTLLHPLACQVWGPQASAGQQEAPADRPHSRSLQAAVPGCAPGEPCCALRAGQVRACLHLEGLLNTRPSDSPVQHGVCCMQPCAGTRPFSLHDCAAKPFVPREPTLGKC